MSSEHIVVCIADVTPGDRISVKDVITTSDIQEAQRTKWLEELGLIRPVFGPDGEEHRAIGIVYVAVKERVSPEVAPPPAAPAPSRKIIIKRRPSASKG